MAASGSLVLQTRLDPPRIGEQKRPWKPGTLPCAGFAAGRRPACQQHIRTSSANFVLKCCTGQHARLCMWRCIINIHIMYIYIDYTLCITQMLSRHVLFIFSFHQNGSPEIIHRERVGNSSPSLDSSTVGLRAARNQSQRPSEPRMQSGESQSSSHSTSHSPFFEGVFQCVCEK